MNSSSVVDPERFVGSAQWRRLFDMDEPNQAQIARLESDLHHIRSDVAAIKVDLCRIHDKIDATNNQVDLLRDRVERMRQDLTQQIYILRNDIAPIKAWTIGMYVVLTGSLFFAMAKGFKWL